MFEKLEVVVLGDWRVIRIWLVQRPRSANEQNLSMPTLRYGQDVAKIRTFVLQSDTPSLGTLGPLEIRRCLRQVVAHQNARCHTNGLALQGQGNSESEPERRDRRHSIVRVGPCSHPVCALHVRYLSNYCLVLTLMSICMLVRYVEILAAGQHTGWSVVVRGQPRLRLLWRCQSNG